MSDIVLRPPSRPISAVIRPPGSKSITNRVLLLAALAEGRSRIENALFADDSRLMIDALSALGVSVAADEDQRTAWVTGCGGRWPVGDAHLYGGNAGTVVRFLAAALCLGQGEYVLDGSARMRQRPISPLVDALRNLGAQISHGHQDGALPIQIAARGLRGGPVRLDAPESSQFVSALLMPAPLARADVLIDVVGPVVSGPYVRMTQSLMERFGAVVIADGVCKFIVPALQRYDAQEIAVEPDASAATYFFAAAGLCGGRVTVEGLGSASIQGDLRFVRLLEQMGCRADLKRLETTVYGPPGGLLRGIDADLGDIPDTAPTLAVLAVFADGPTRIRNVANLRAKESDRIAALAAGIQRLGGEVEIHADGLTILPAREPCAASIDTFEDHRIAMSFALAGLRLDGVTIRDAECVAKTYPDFFRDWERMQT